MIVMIAIMVLNFTEHFSYTDNSTACLCIVIILAIAIAIYSSYQAMKQTSYVFQITSISSFSRAISTISCEAPLQMLTSKFLATGNENFL